MNMSCVLLLLLTLILVNDVRLSAAYFGREVPYDVLRYGARGDGETDDTNAFLKAWEAACNDVQLNGDVGQSTPVFYVPEGKTFRLQHLELTGPCKSSSIHVQISGILLAPDNLRKRKGECIDGWINFKKVENLKIDGKGKLFGNGEIWWDSIKRQQITDCTSPTSLRVQGCDNFQIRGLEFVDSPRNHISITTSTGGEISNLTITAPDESPNTDGIDLAGATDIRIYNSTIKTGDDCIAINGGSSRINVTNVHCGPGHGISVGSLGRGGKEDIVEDVYVRNCTLEGTQNGVRIKTWPGGHGYARRITFKDIIITESYNPIIIDQDYCNGGSHCGQSSNAVQISDVTFSNIKGSSAEMGAISIKCTTVGEGCKNIIMENINLWTTARNHNDNKAIYATCINAHGTARNVYPQVSCLESKRFGQELVPKYEFAGDDYLMNSDLY